MGTFFTHLHCHSNYSFLDSTVSLDALVAWARKNRVSAVALTDTNRLTGAVAFYQKARAAGVRPIVGAEVTLSDGSSLVLLVQNQTGYENLAEILTRGHLKGGPNHFDLDLADLADWTEGLVALSGNRRNPAVQFLRRRQPEKAVGHLRRLQALFGGRFYVELTRLTPADDLLNANLAFWARKLGIGLVATNDVHLVRPEEWPLWRVLRAIDQNTTLERAAAFGRPEQYLKSPAEMARQFRKYPDALLNTLRIAENCRFDFALGKSVFPTVRLPSGQTPFGKLKQLCDAGLRKRYRVLTSAIQERLHRELLTVRKLGFVEYFLIVKEIVDFCRREKIPCVGRGSAADSLIAYTLEITHADPIRFNLYFERFLNPERRDPPDIDLDICWKNRDRVLRFVYDRFGHDRTALIATVVTFQARSAVREVAKVLGISSGEIEPITKRLPHGFPGRSDWGVEVASLTRNWAGGNPMLLRVADFARQLVGFPHHLSVHPGGTVIAPDKITHFAPLEMASGGLVISQFDMHSIEKIGLVKMDLLGVRSLTIISEAVAAIEKRTGTTFDIGRIPEEDADTLQLLRSGRSLGCFQLESPAMRGLLKKMRIERLDDIVAAISLIRPGPAEGGMKDVYVKRRAGLEPVSYPHPALEPILRETYGVLVYQEQVLLAAQAVAGLSLGEADILRKAMTKKRSTQTLVQFRKAFLRGAERQGVSRQIADGIFEWLTHFASYGFNKAHSATYGILAYQTAFLKRHFPLEYMLALLNNPGGYYPQFAYVEEARRLGIRLLPPDIARSQAGFSPEGNGIRVGLSSIVGLSRAAVQRILSERQKEPFHNLYDFLLRSRVNQAEAESLIQTGALACLDVSEPNLLARTRIFFKNKRRAQIVERLTAELNLPPYTKRQRVLHELHFLRFAVTEHPLRLFLETQRPEKYVLSTELEKFKDREVTILGWGVISRRIVTAKRQSMKFLTVEDPEGIVEVILFPDVYRRYARLLQGRGPFQITGKVQSRIPGEANVIASRIRVLHLFEENSGFRAPFGDIPFNPSRKAV